MAVTSKLLFILALLHSAGCSNSSSGSGFPFDFARPDIAMCERYGPARIDILPLTALVQAQDSTRDSTLNVYICLLDSFDSQIKAPAVFYFHIRKCCFLEHTLVVSNYLLLSLHLLFAFQLGTR